MRFRLLLLFVVTPLVEMALLIRLGQWMGFGPTVLLVLLTGVVGGTMARSQGLATWRRFQSNMSSGRLPTDEILDGVIILVAAVLLLTPGVLTDIVGFLGLMPWVRVRVRRIVGSRVRLQGSAAGTAGPRSTSDSSRAEPDVDFESGWSGQARRRPRHEVASRPRSTRDAGTGT